MLVFGGAVNNFSGYHLIPVTEALGISRTAFSLAESMGAVMGVISTFFSGIMIQKFGYKKVTAFGLLVASAAYAVFFSIQNYAMLIAGCLMIGVSKGICFVAGVSRIVNVWFHKCRGTILGIVTAATGLGSTFLGFAQAAAIEHVSWRLSFGIVALLQLLVAVLVFLLVFNEPENMGLKPFGEGWKDSSNKKESAWQGFTGEALKRNAVFYIFCAAAFFSCVCILGTQYNIVPYFQDSGMSVSRASKLYGTMMLVLGIIKLLMGVLCDAVGAKRVLIMCHIACTLGLLAISFLPQTDVPMLISLLVYDLGIPLTTMIFPLVSSEIFGNKAYGWYVGIVMSMTTAGNIISGPAASAIRDLFGSYKPVFVGAAALATIMIPVYCALFLTSKRQKEKMI
jgi:sugar phosphate permease